MTSDKPTRNDIHDLLEKINNDLNEFIKNRIHDGILSDKDWSSLFTKPEMEWCWEALSCNKEDCPVRKQDDYRCWLIAGTLCGGMVQGVFAQKFDSCITCEVYKQYHRRPIRSLYENISILISHMSDEAYEFRHEARTDSLTKLLSRTTFDEIINQEVKRSKRMNGIRLTLVVFDLDHFKEINDEAGHLVGDYYLVEFAKLLRNVTRETDFVFRTGGDEFTVLMVGGRNKEMLFYIDRIQEAIAGWNANKDRPYSYVMAASVGGACLSDLGYNIDKCVAKADERMYQNKQERKAAR
ncbi:MAG: GGDEF domain-containing protein [Candidatus Aegiribacteria sp.]|nr:GGDEF domain-containing protein [Candidatus Aegiribacteria sp.]